jgi:hypothetical protein
VDPKRTCRDLSKSGLRIFHTHFSKVNLKKIPYEAVTNSRDTKTGDVNGLIIKQRRTSKEELRPHLQKIEVLARQKEWVCGSKSIYFNSVFPRSISSSSRTGSTSQQQNNSRMGVEEAVCCGAESSR